MMLKKKIVSKNKMGKFEKDGSEKIVFQGKIIQVVNQPMVLNNKKIIFEIARRSPGVRLIIRKDNKFLLTKEHRYETNDFDYRLPGGKVFDTLEEYKKTLNDKNNLMKYAKDAAKKECIQETGLKANKISYYKTSKAGATIESDLLYFLITDFTYNEQKLEEGEIIKPEWKSVNEIKKLIINSKMKEDRSVGVFVQYLMTEKLF